MHTAGRQVVFASRHAAEAHTRGPDGVVTMYSAAVRALRSDSEYGVFRLPAAGSRVS